MGVSNLATFCITYFLNDPKDIDKERDGAFDGLVKQSKKMTFLSDKDHPPVEVGNTVGSCLKSLIMIAQKAIPVMSWQL